MAGDMTADVTADSPTLETRGIYMAFGGIDVLRDVDFDIHPGEVHGLVGENGAGKSTLLKIIAGVHQPRAGEIILEGTPVRMPSPHAANERGIALIHQEPLTFPDLEVAENIFIGRQPMTRTGPVSHLDWQEMYDRSRDLLYSLGVEIDPRTKVRGLSIADQQMVEMASALSQDAKILLMDEPTSALTPTEVEDLFVIIRRLREQGKAVVFISHRVEEVLDICDRVTVLRDGEKVGSAMATETSVDEVIHLMVGRVYSELFQRQTERKEAGEPVLEVSGLCRRMKFDDISFDVRAGEIVGVAGLVGAGRTDVARALFGTLDIDSGTVSINGEPVDVRQPRDALSKGLIYLPEDRQHHGLLMPMSVTKNTTMAILERIARRGWLRDRAAREITRDYVDKLRIVLRSVRQPVRQLSGGNQQKVVLSKWLLTTPSVMLMDEPTRGIDVGAKAEVHRLMSELAESGMAILMISSELPEILSMSDRIIVMREGRITGRFDIREASAERIMAAATGQELQETQGHGSQGS